MSEQDTAQAVGKNKFMGWRDLVITPLVMTTILGVSLTTCLFGGRALEAGLFARVLLFFACSTTSTILVIHALVRVFRLVPGVYSYERHPARCYAWNLVGFLSITFLWFETNAGLLPPPLRQLYVGLLGGRIGPGIVPMGGRVTDPWLITIGPNSILGDDALLIPHLFTPQHSLALGRIVIGSNVVIGARSVVMAGTTIGDGALVKAMSFVPAYTKIGPHEVWAGNPAVKVGVLSAAATPSPPPGADPRADRAPAA